MKINISQKLLNIKGKPVTTEEPIPGVSDAVMQEITDYPIPTADILLEKFKEWQEKLKETKKRDMLIRDYFLTILGQRFEIKDKKENFWTTELGIVFADEKNKIVEISEKKIDFLKRIIENNKITQQTPMGAKEVELFFPYELGQILKVLEGEDEEKEKPKKEK